MTFGSGGIFASAQFRLADRAIDSVFVGTSLCTGGRYLVLSDWFSSDVSWRLDNGDVSLHIAAYAVSGLVSVAGAGGFYVHGECVCVLVSQCADFSGLRDMTYPADVADDTLSDASWFHRVDLRVPLVTQCVDDDVFSAEFCLADSAVYDRVAGARFRACRRRVVLYDFSRCQVSCRAYRVFISVYVATDAMFGLESVGETGDRFVYGVCVCVGMA